MNDSDMESASIVEAFIYETSELLDQLDEILLESEKEKNISEENINSIFRITHTIKGSAAMLEYEGMSTLAHAVEDVFYIIREDPTKLDAIFSTVFDLVFQTSDFLRKELEGIQSGNYTPADSSDLVTQLHQQAAIMKGEQPSTEPAAGSQSQPNEAKGTASVTPEGESGHQGEMKIRVCFEDGCQMENMRSFMLLTQLQQCCSSVRSVPEHPETSSDLSAEIAKNGLLVYCCPTDGQEDVLQVIEQALNVKSYEVLPSEEPQAAAKTAKQPDASKKAGTPATSASGGQPESGKALVKQSLVSVNQSKLDHLMDLVGEIVTAESMVARDPDLKGLKLDHFSKSVRELRKLTDELQDVVMSIRMVPLHGTFQKMSRIVRDMAKKLDKQAELETIGGDTEVDKTINDAIADPFMHMIRNSMDHAIESPEERVAMGKSPVGKVTLSARNVGGEILIDVADDGCGLDAAKILAKAKANGILTKPDSEYTEKEAFHLIMLPGFSTNTEVTEYSGRGVGMDVVRKNIEKVGGSISIDSKLGEGTTFTIKIPLTLAIVDGMNFLVGDTTFTLPITSIRQSFKVADESQIIHSASGNEMIWVRGECLPIIRLHQRYEIEPRFRSITDGILIQIENGTSNACIFADELLGEYQVVVKSFPAFFNPYNLKAKGLSGCSILGDGTMSLILDANALINNR